MPVEPKWRETFVRDLVSCETIGLKPERCRKNLGVMVGLPHADPDDRVLGKQEPLEFDVGQAPPYQPLALVGTQDFQDEGPHQQ